MAEEFDVIVIGGGPSGSSATAFLAKAGKRVLLLDRAKFPREKVCGDGISGRSVGVLRELGLLESFKSVEHQDMFGVTFSSPNGTVAPIPSASGKDAPGFVCRREVFDNVLFQHAKSLAAKTIEGFFATDLVLYGQNVARRQGQPRRQGIGIPGEGGRRGGRRRRHDREEARLI